MTSEPVRIKSKDHIENMVYKFRTWNDIEHYRYHKKLLIDREMYFSSPQSFNDPFDCCVVTDYSMLQKNPELQQTHFRSIIVRTFPNITEQQINEKVEQLIKDSRFNDPQWILLANQKQRESFYKSYGVFSFSKTKSNILLWSHYADSHQGFCLGFDLRLIKNHLENKVGGCDVFYSVDYPKIPPINSTDNQFMQQISTKSIDWKYEEEFRLFIVGAEQSIEVPKQCFKEITLGCKMENKYKKEIIDFIKKEIPEMRVIQAIQSDDKFQLTFENINL